MEIPGFPNVGVKKVIEGVSNRNGCTQKGGFQAMGLSHIVLQGIVKRGYKIPTPIQRKTIPLILEGRDVVAMARTGSGKTACFLIPLLEKLKQRDPTKGARALILSPTRELAIQTFKFFRDLAKFADLKAVLVLGGDSIDSQFSAMHTSPDVIIATPGRFLHLCVEMNLKLTSIVFVVFDEADRLFEMGFGIHLNEILKRLPTTKQTVMFSATLPKSIVDFADAGLSDPTLIRLDVESKLPQGLSLKFLYCRPDERYAVLLTLLKHVIPEDSQTMVFLGTQYHVELLSNILNEAGISNTLIYSNMDPTARKINTAKFINKKARVLAVTDIVARGIDIPYLDYVINFHFPAKSKLFVHRVGRCARAGQLGTAFSIVSTDDEAHLLDLYLFLNKSLNSDVYTIPDEILEEEHRGVLHYLENYHIKELHKTSENAYKKYINLRPPASVESNKKCKEVNFAKFSVLEELAAAENNEGEQRKRNEGKSHLKGEKSSILSKLSCYRPTNTIFELNANEKSSGNGVMKKKRAEHATIIWQYRKQKQAIICSDSNLGESYNRSNKPQIERKDETPDVLNKTVDDYYIPYQSLDKHTEDGLIINNFKQAAQNAELSVMEKREFMYAPGMKRWDRVKKKMMAVKDPREGKIRTESGAWIPATYKTNRYKEWKEKTKIKVLENEESDLSVNLEKNYFIRELKHNVKRKQKRKESNSELINAEQIVKKRLRVEIAKKKELDNKMKRMQRKGTNKK